MPERNMNEFFCCKRAHIATCQHSGWDWERKRWQQSNSFTFKKKSKLKKGSLVYKCRRLHAEMPSSYQAKMWKFKIILIYSFCVVNVNLDWKTTTAQSKFMKKSMANCNFQFVRLLNTLFLYWTNPISPISKYKKALTRIWMFRTKDSKSLQKE